MFEHRSDRNAGCYPDVLEMFGRAVIDDGFRSFTADCGKRTFECTHDISNGYVRRTAIKTVATVDAAAARHDAIVSEVSKNRLEKLHRNVLRDRNGVTFDERSWIIFRNCSKFKQSAHRVINFGRHMHGPSQAEGAVNV